MTVEVCRLIAGTTNDAAEDIVRGECRISEIFLRIESYNANR